ncbi:MAG TPA: folate-binding protein [Rubrivivax sp.]|nr:folate-binding protein [Burkholderiales bacterium]HNU12455.1 folate-binding protein [Rubrivivax sp.]
MNAPETPTAAAPGANTAAAPASLALDGAQRLSDWGLIRATGADARSFLHSQLTQDVESIAGDELRLAGYCSPKGRMLASFLVWAEDADDLLLACSADLLAPVHKRLSMYVLRARCKLVDASGEQALWGLAGTSALQVATDLKPWHLRVDGARRVLRLPDALLEDEPVARAMLVQEAGDPAPAARPLAPAAWAALEARSGVARIVAATQDRFVPQMVNFELVGGVGFQKGCYPGQEVVARSQYRGTLKRRGFLLHGSVAMAPGQEIFHSADPGQPAGMVALAGSLAEGEHDAFAELKIAATQGGSLHLGSADGPALTLGRLPYALPAESA